MVIHQSTEDLNEHLKRQIGFIRRSCEAYDKGFTDEAIRLATIVRVLVHDTTQSKSLLGQLGIKNSMEFFDSSDDYDPATCIFDFRGLVLLRVGGHGGNFIPRCLVPPRPDLTEKWKPFGQWWQKTVIVDAQREKFSRGGIILALSNKEGGAHIDPKLDDAYAALTRENSMGWTFEVAGGKGIITGIETASSRQIAHEILISIEKVRPDLKSLSTS